MPRKIDPLPRVLRAALNEIQMMITAQPKLTEVTLTPLQLEHFDKHFSERYYRSIKIKG